MMVHLLVWSRARSVSLKDTAYVNVNWWWKTWWSRWRRTEPTQRKMTELQLIQNQSVVILYLWYNLWCLGHIILRTPHGMVDMKHKWNWYTARHKGISAPSPERDNKELQLTSESMGCYASYDIFDASSSNPLYDLVDMIPKWIPSHANTMALLYQVHWW